MLFIKNLLDFLFALTASLVLLPFLLLLAVVLWIIHGENPIFTQKRVGKNGKPFTVFKFKTVSTKRHRENSSFIRFVHDSHLDELPQLVNIIFGSMSFVGPRPHIPEQVQLYEEWQRKRLVMKPGFTGLRQLKSAYGKIEFNQFIEDDILYVETWCLWLDAKIVFKSICSFMGLIFSGGKVS